PVTKVLPSLENASARTMSVWSASVACSLPVLASHSRAVRSLLAEATVWPSGEKATANTIAVCPTQECTSLPVSTSQIFTSPGVSWASQRPAADASFLPSGEKTTDRTGMVCPVKVARSAPLLRSRRRIVPSRQPAAIVLPSGDPSTLFAEVSRVGCVARRLSPVTCQTRTVLSSAPVTSRLPSGENCANQTCPLWPVSVARGATALGGAAAAG